MKKKILTLSLFAIATAHSFTLLAQGDGAAILKAGTEDANKILDAYMKPLFKGFASGSTIGWYNTAKPHGTGGFDLTFSLGVFNVPTADQTYTFRELNLGQGPYKFVPKTAETDPDKKLGTLLGPSVDKQQYNINYSFRYDTVIGGNPYTIDTSINIASITMPKGSGFNTFVALPPALQFSVGIYKNTEVMLRVLPQMNLAEGFKSGMFGMGIKHDVKQWIPGISDVPLWDWSVLFAFNSYKNSYSLQENERLKVDGNAEYQLAYNASNFAGKAYDNQRFEFNGSSWMVGTVVSANLLFFTPYLGINYNKASTEFMMMGDYPIVFAESDKNSPYFGQSKIEEVKDPIKINGAVSGLRINPGFRLKFLIFTLHYDYSWNTYGYNLHTAGFGLNLQSIVPFKL